MREKSSGRRHDAANVSGNRTPRSFLLSHQRVSIKQTTRCWAPREGSFWVGRHRQTADQRMSIFDAVSPPAYSIRDPSVLVLAVAALSFLVVERVLLLLPVPFLSSRRRQNHGTTASLWQQVDRSRLDRRAGADCVRACDDAHALGSGRRCSATEAERWNTLRHRGRAPRVITYYLRMLTDRLGSCIAYAEVRANAAVQIRPISTKTTRTSTTSPRPPLGK